MTTLDKTSTASIHHPSRKKPALLAALCLLVAFAPGQTLAKSCRNVHLEVRNQTGKSIKMIDLDYWDSESEKWRSEPVRNEVIKNGHTWQENRNLEFVNNQPVKIRVEYRTLKWHKFSKKWKWAMKKSSLTMKNPKTCTKNTDYIISLR